MRTVTIQLESLTPYSASKYFEPDIQKGETKDAHEKRRWKEKAHINDLKNIFIPGVAFKLALDETAQLLNEKIPGKGNQTWTGQFATGVVAMSDVDLGIKSDELKSIQIFAHANGKRGPGTRVMRFFPIVYQWTGELVMNIFNDTLPEEIFERFFEQAGLLAGVGRGRPITKSPAGNGRFKPVKFTWFDS